MITQTHLFRLILAALLIAALPLAGCDSDSGMDDPALRQVSYSLSAQSNSGALPNGVDATVTFWELNDTQTLVTLELTGGATGADVSHPAHIHRNSASESGPIEYYLSPLDGSGGGGTSARVINESFDTLIEFNGYVNIHESVANLETIVSQGNIGSNADATPTEGLDIVDTPESSTYDLAANANSGSVAPNGIAGTVRFQELTANLTLATLSLNTTGATGASVSHPAHIHDNTASQGGPIAIYLSPIDGSDPEAKSSKLIDRSLADLRSFNGYVNIHESVANLDTIVSQGNIGANATSSDGGNGEGGGTY